MVQNQFKLIKINTVKYAPCCIDYSKKFQTFIIGTYELIGDDDSEHVYNDQQLKQLNNRVGNLNIFSQNDELLCEYECNNGGGIFDLKLSDQSNNYEIIICAHSNGMIGIYRYFDRKIIENIKQIDTGQSMLTTIDDLFSKDIWNIYVGSSDGKVLCYDVDKDFKDATKLIDSTITKHSLSIWCLKLLHLMNFELIFIGSEDSQWSIYEFSDKKLNQLMKNSDASAGNTSIEIYHPKIIDENASMTLLIGSYDEHLRIYDITIRKFVDGPRIIDCKIKNKIHIDGGGIWRILCHNENNFLISAMYSGAYLLSFSDDNFFKHQLIKFVIEENDQINDDHLIYGIKSNDCHSDVLISSFYAKKIFHFKQMN